MRPVPSLDAKRCAGVPSPSFAQSPSLARLGAQLGEDLRRNIEPVKDNAQIIDIAQRLPGPRSRVGDAGVARGAGDGMAVRSVLQRLIENQPRHVVGMLAGRQKRRGIGVGAADDLVLVDVDAAVLLPVIDVIIVRVLAGLVGLR